MSDETGRGPRDEAEGEAHATARHIARVASRLFAGRGFAATPVRAIAEAAGVTCPTLYYHFKSKEGLAQELLTRPSAEVVAALGRPAGGRGAGPGRPAGPAWPTRCWSSAARRRSGPDSSTP